MSDPYARLHPLLRKRWSPRLFDAEHALSAEEVDVLLESARWAPSAGNSQPWAFVVARRGDPVHARVLQHLAPSSGRWAPSASLLVLNLCRRLVDDSDLEYSEFAAYDLGQAVAHMTVQAQAGGLAARQFRAFDKAALTAEFAIAREWELMSMTAFGRPTTQSAADARDRRSLSDLHWDR
ncbi:nitroreductase family protein [Nocardioides sp. LHG3406-4]|uniref:nitroreductase family protein n=1 Tax=Nocardioides sp. LHG3406-4 TaxID=2804575 RepID=UPI003CEA63FD